LVVAQLQRVYEQHAAARNGRLFAVTAKTQSSESYMDFTRTHKGDATRGRELFQNQAELGCLKCHFGLISP
jgi:hypothetical protein